jgi:hypothetical protein
MRNLSRVSRFLGQGQPLHLSTKKKWRLRLDRLTHLVVARQARSASDDTQGSQRRPDVGARDRGIRRGAITRLAADWRRSFSRGRGFSRRRCNRRAEHRPWILPYLPIGTACAWHSSSGDYSRARACYGRDDIRLRARAIRVASILDRARARSARIALKPLFDISDFLLVRAIDSRGAARV